MSDDQNITFDQLVPDDGDMAVVFRDHGRTGAGFVRHGGDVLKMPMTVDITYAPEGGLKPIKLNVRAGWTQKEWKAAE